MPLYEFRCDGCETTDTTFLWGTQFTRERKCGRCGCMARLIPSLTTPPEIRFSRRYHYGVGGYVESTADVNRIAKEKNLIHIGRDHGG